MCHLYNGDYDKVQHGAKVLNVSFSTSSYLKPSLRFFFLYWEKSLAQSQLSSKQGQLLPLDPKFFDAYHPQTQNMF